MINKYLFTVIFVAVTSVPAFSQVPVPKPVDDTLPFSSKNLYFPKRYTKYGPSDLIRRSIYRTESNIEFYERKLSPEITKDNPMYEAHLSWVGHELLIESYGKPLNSPFNGTLLPRKIRYPTLKEGDIFPLPGAICVYHSFKPKTDLPPGGNAEAFVLDREKYPDNVTVGFGTFIYPFIPKEEGKNKCNSICGRKIEIRTIKINDDGQPQVQLTYAPKNNDTESNDNVEIDIVTKWFYKNDIIPFFRTPMLTTLTHRGGKQEVVDLSLDHWPQELCGKPFGYRIVNIVPRDPYPIRSTGVMRGLKEMKGRVIGWIELDSTPIPLNEKGEVAF